MGRNPSRKASTDLTDLTLSLLIETRWGKLQVTQNLTQREEMDLMALVRIRRSAHKR